MSRFVRICTVSSLVCGLLAAPAPAAADIGSAVDNTSLVWVSSGDNVWGGQTAVTRDGVDAAQSGAISNFQSTWIETTVSGPGTLSFWWKVSSEADFDRLSFYLDGVLQSGGISGEVDWQRRVFNVGPGSHTLRWTYSKDVSWDVGSDAGWVDQVEYAFAGGTHTLTVNSASPDAGVTIGVLPADLDGSALGATPFVLRYLDTTTATLTAPLAAGGRPFGSWSGCTATSGSRGEICSAAMSADRTVTATYVDPLPLADALDAAGLPWATGGNAGWLGQATTTHDGVDAGQSGVITDLQSSYAEATVTGPGTLSYFWKVSSEAGWDFLSFTIDGLPAGSISGNQDWAQRVLYIGGAAATPHTLRWSYAKDDSVSENSDSGWLDQVVWQAATQDRTLTVSSTGAAAVPIAVAPADANGAGDGTTGFARLYNDLTPVTLTAPLVSGGQAFAGWTGCTSISGTGGSVCSVLMSAGDATATASYVAPPTIGQAFDDTGRTWTPGGTVAPIGQTAVSHDGSDAVLFGGIAAGQNSWFETSVTGPGVVSYFGKVSATGAGYHSFSIDGAMQPGVFGGQTDWQLLRYNVAAGVHTLRWTYTKPGGDGAVGDAAWVDQFLWQPSAGSAALTVASTNPAAGVYVLPNVLDSGGLGGGATPFVRDYPGGYVVTLTAPAGASFTGWSGCDATSGTQGSVCTVALSGSRAVTANYAAGLAVGEALDAPGLDWVLGGNALWYGESTVTHDGADAGQAGAIGNSQSTWVETTAVGPGTLSFFWKVSSQAAPNTDRVRFFRNTVLQTVSSGQVDWRQYTFNIPGGVQTLRWEYLKNSSQREGLDTAWLDQVSWQPSTTTHLLAVNSANPSAGVAMILSVADNGGWANGSTPLTRTHNNTTALSVTAPLQHAGAGLAVTFFGGWTGCDAVSGASGEICTVAMSADRIVTAAYVDPVSLQEALDLPGQGWSGGGNAPWFGQAAVTHDGVDAAQSAPVGHGQSTSFETTVSGPGSISYFWKVSSEVGSDLLSFAIDAVTQAGSISGGVDWQPRSHNVPAGVHTLTWAFTRDGAGGSGSNAGWVDQVAWLPSSATHTLSVTSTDPGSGVPIAVDPVDNAGQGDGATPFARTHNDTTTVTLTAPLAAANGNRFREWLGCNAVSGASGEVCTATAATDRVLTAVYGGPRLTVRSVDPDSGAAITVGTVDLGGLGDGTTPLVRTYASASAVSVTAALTAGSGSFFLWSGCTSVSGTRSETCTVTLNADTTVTAYYLSPTRTLSVGSLSPGAGVWVTVTPIDKLNAASGLTPFERFYRDGTTVSLAAALTADGNVFAGWTGCPAASGQRGELCTATLVGNWAPTVRYAPALLFSDNFRHGTARGDKDWKAAAGRWGVNPLKRFVSGSLTGMNLAIVKRFGPPAGTRLTGRIEAKVQLDRAAATPNALFLFSYLGPTKYRYVQLVKGKVRVGQVGALGGTPKGVKLTKAVSGLVAGKTLLPRVDFFADGTVKFYLRGVLKATYKFAQGVAGGVGVGALKTHSQFDDYKVLLP